MAFASSHTAKRPMGLAGEAAAWAMFCLAAILTVQAGLSTGFFDTDYFWHLETGRWIAAEGRLPEGDIFSHSFAGEPWVLHEWLAQLLLFKFYELGGREGLLLATALLSGSALYFAYRLANGELKRPLVAVLLTIVMGAGLFNFVSPRPQVFSYLLFALWFTVIWRARYQGRTAALWTLPVIMVLWVNLHAAYLIGLAFLAAFLLFDGLAYLLGARSPGTPARYLKAMAGAFVVSVLAVLVNPDGWERLVYPFQVMGLQATTVIAEWGSFNFHIPKTKWILASFFLYLALAAARPRRPHLSELLVPLCTLGAALLSARHAPFAALVIIAYGGQALSEIEGFRRWRDGAEAAAPPMLRRLSVALVPALFLLLLASPFNPRYWERMDGVTPTAMADVILSESLPGPIFNNRGIGGYLIHALGPDHPILIDGRSDLFGDAFTLEIEAASRGQEGWRETLERWDAALLVLYRDTALAALVDSDPGYVLVCEDVAFSLFKRRAPGEPVDAQLRAAEIERPCAGRVPGAVRAAAGDELALGGKP